MYCTINIKFVKVLCQVFEYSHELANLTLTLPSMDSPRFNRALYHRKIVNCVENTKESLLIDKNYDSWKRITFPKLHFISYTNTRFLRISVLRGTLSRQERGLGPCVAFCRNLHVSSPL